jgi:hypothetical protein
VETEAAPVTTPAPASPSRRFDPRRLWACTRRETMELLRDPIRLSFAFLGPLLLMLAFGFGISFDVENLKFAAYDQDNSMESRQLIEAFSSSRYFDEQPPIRSAEELDRRLRSGELQLVIEVPPSFGRDLMAARKAELSVWLDGAMPFRAETTRGYVAGLTTQFAQSVVASHAASSHAPTPFTIETRFRYNQDFKSANAMVPSVIMLMLMLIPAIMSAIGVVREKETGSPDRDPEDKHPDQGIGLGPGAGDAALCLCYDWLRSADLELHAHPGRGCLRHGDPVGYPRCQLFRPHGAGSLALGRGTSHRREPAPGLVPAGQRGRLHQGAGCGRSLAQSRDAGLLLPAFPRGRTAGAAQAGGLRWPRWSYTSRTSCALS